MLLKGDLFPVTSAFETKRRITIGTVRGIFSFLQFGRNQKENTVSMVGKVYSFFCTSLTDTCIKLFIFNTLCKRGLVLKCSFPLVWGGKKNSCLFNFTSCSLGFFYDLGRTEISRSMSLITFTIQYPLTISVL